jgi:hypothetical protein
VSSAIASQPIIHIDMCMYCTDSIMNPIIIKHLAKREEQAKRIAYAKAYLKARRVAK